MIYHCILSGKEPTPRRYLQWDGCLDAQNVDKKIRETFPELSGGVYELMKGGRQGKLQRLPVFSNSEELKQSLNRSNLWIRTSTVALPNPPPVTTATATATVNVPTPPAVITTTATATATTPTPVLPVKAITATASVTAPAQPAVTTTTATTTATSPSPVPLTSSATATTPPVPSTTVPVHHVNDDERLVKTTGFRSKFI